MATLLGGATMNFVLAILIFAILALTEGIQDPAMPGPLVLQAVVPGAPAEQAGLRVGDQIIAADDIPLASMAELQAITKANAGHPVTYRFLRPDSTVGISRTLEAVIVPRTSSLEGRLGVSIQVPIRSATIPEAVWGGIRQTAEIVVVTVQIPAMLIREGRPISEAQLTGPVGIAVLTGQVVRSAIDINSIKPVMGFMAVLSTALGFTNLLPVPGLDGGRLLFVLAEAIRRRRVAPAQEGLVHLIGFGMLLILLGVVTVREVWSLLNGTFPNIGGP
jgi:regulator of sigma E protease